MTRTSFSMAQIAALKDQLSALGCTIHERGSREYARATRLWNGAVERKPALVAACSATNDVRTACWQRGQPDFQYRCAMAARTGLGEPCGMASLVLDLAPTRHFSVNVEAIEATIGGGVTVADLNAAAGRQALVAAKLGIAIPDALVGNDLAIGRPFGENRGCIGAPANGGAPK
jgi:FAD/FMN-containing dehydrogenase